MKFSLSVNNHNLDYKDTLEEVYEGINYKANVISIFHSRVAYVTSKLSKGIGSKINALIDYPFGIASIKNKVYAILEVVKLVDGLDVVVNSAIYLDGDLEKTREEIKQICQLSHQYKKNIRIIIDSRSLEDKDLFTIANIAHRGGADEIILGTGLIMDSLTDSLISAEYLYRNLKILPWINTRELSGTVQIAPTSHILGIQANSATGLKTLLSTYR